MSDIVFIKNEEDYLNYKKLKPYYKFERCNVKFICKSCQKETIKKFRSLTLDFLCHSCQSSKSIKNAQEKTKETCLKKYGVDNYAKTKECQNKTKETCLKKYGVDNVAKSKEIQEKTKITNIKKFGVACTLKDISVREKIKETMLLKYGVEYPAQSEEIKNTIKNTNTEKYGGIGFESEYLNKKQKQTVYDKYGTKNYSSTEDFKNKYKETCLKKYNSEHYYQSLIYKNKCNDTLSNRLLNYNLKILYKNKDIVKLYCNNCENEFIISYSGFISLLNKYNNSFCPHCTRIIEHGKSLKEKELLEYIKTFYIKQIDINTRNIIPPKEIDIYLPDLKIGFEFDGTFWHADPRFYKPDDLIKEQTAAQIWEKDEVKNKLAESLGIKLIRIKEYDWDNFKIDIKEKIKKLIIGE